MLRRFAALIAVASLCSCATTRPPREVFGRVLSGLDVIEQNGFAQLRGKKIGLITNHTGKNAQGRTTVEVLAEAPGVELSALFSPEHGFTGVSEDNRISSSTLLFGAREIPIHSLYAGGIEGMRPRQEDLAGLDALVFDIQDIGARFYTYLATMGMAMEEAAKAGTEFIVLDRPNPINGVTMEGPMLDDLSLRRVTATAYFPVPVRHGMTAGEIARLHAAEIKGRLTVVTLRGWSRDLWYDQTGLPWIAPSPNMPDLEAATLYPGVAIFEASNLAVGRGTPWPFRWIGAPWLDASRVVADMNAALLDGIQFSVESATPTKSVFRGQRCEGVRLTITDRERVRPLAVFRKLHESIRAANPRDFHWRWDEVKRMVGTAEFQRIDERGGDPLQFERLFEQGPARFEIARKPFLLY